MFQTLFNAGLHQQPVNYHVNGVVLALVELDVIQFFIQVAKLPVNTGAHKTVLHQLGQFGFKFALTPAHQRGQHHDAVLGLEFHDPLHNLFG